MARGRLTREMAAAGKAAAKEGKNVQAGLQSAHDTWMGTTSTPQNNSVSHGYLPPSSGSDSGKDQGMAQ